MVELAHYWSFSEEIASRFFTRPGLEGFYCNVNLLHEVWWDFESTATNIAEFAAAWKIVEISIIVCKHSSSFKNLNYALSNIILHIFQILTDKLTYDGFNGDVAGVDFASEFSYSLIRILIIMWVNVCRSICTKKWGRHCKVITTSWVIFIATFCICQHDKSTKAIAHKRLMKTTRVYRIC